MYKNIRYTSYNIIGEICKTIGAQNCLQYRTDGIFVLPEDSAEVKRLMRKYRMPFKTIKCHKVDDHHYRIDDEAKRF